MRTRQVIVAGVLYAVVVVDTIGLIEELHPREDRRVRASYAVPIYSRDAGLATIPFAAQPST